MKKNSETSPNIVELPSPGTGDDLEVNHSMPLVTMPSYDVDELGDPSDSSGGLTSPNLVHSINPGLSLASSANFARMQSSYSSHQERKESSSSSVTKTVGLGDQIVTSSANSSSKQMSRTDAAAAMGQLTLGEDGQAIITGTAVKSVSSESHKSSSSSQRQITANGEVTKANHHSSSSYSSSKKSSRVTMTSSNVTRSLLTSSQVLEQSL